MDKILDLEGSSGLKFIGQGGVLTVIKGGGRGGSGGNGGSGGGINEPNGGVVRRFSDTINTIRKFRRLWIWKCGWIRFTR